MSGTKSVDAFREEIKGRFDYLNEESLLAVAKDPDKRLLVEKLILDIENSIIVRQCALDALIEAVYQEGIEHSSSNN